MGSNLHRDSGQLTLNGLRWSLSPSCLLGFSFTATALKCRRTHQTEETKASENVQTFVYFKGPFSRWGGMKEIRFSRSYLKTCFNCFWVQVEASLHCIFTMTQALQSHFVSLTLNKKLRWHSCISKKASRQSLCLGRDRDWCKDLPHSLLWHTHICHVRFQSCNSQIPLSSLWYTILQEHTPSLFHSLTHWLHYMHMKAADLKNHLQSTVNFHV